VAGISGDRAGTSGDRAGTSGDRAGTSGDRAGTSGADAAIQVHGLTKAYGDHEAVKGIDLHVARGEIFALLGPNGAGKTTTVEILEGHRHRTAGDVSVLGFDPGHAELAYRSRIGIVLQETGVERFLTVAEVIDQFRSLYPHPLARDDVIEAVGLGEKRDERVGRLSGGQQRRLDVAVGLAGDPDLLFLDEPTTGFDPGARRGAWDMVRNLQSLGKTVFLTTHYMDEAQALADRVAVIAGGLIVAEGPPDSLADRQLMRTRVSFGLPDGVGPPASSGAELGPHGRWMTETDDATALLAELAPWAVSAGVELGALEVAQPTLEDVYLSLTGQASGGFGTAPVGDDDGDAAPARGRGRRSRRGGSR
jgi:ABC-2 type transport system ATP-binding protein